MSGFSAIDLSLLPAPDVIETVAYAETLSALRNDLLARAPELAEAMALESEPINKLLEVCAYRETIIRARVNDAGRAVMLAYATGGDLDHLAAFYGVSRLLVAAADPTATPPVAAVYETDARLRARAQLALEGYTTAGPVGAYIFHAMSASALVKDVGGRCFLEFPRSWWKESGALPSRADAAGEYSAMSWAPLTITTIGRLAPSNSATSFGALTL